MYIAGWFFFLNGVSKNVHKAQMLLNKVNAEVLLTHLYGVMSSFCYWLVNRPLNLFATEI